LGRPGGNCSTCFRFELGECARNQRPDGPLDPAIESLGKLQAFYLKSARKLPTDVVAQV